MDPYVTPDTISAKGEEWLKQISAFNTHTMQLQPEKAALLVIDMQYFFLDPASPSYTCGGLAILPKLQKGIKAFRQVQNTVLYKRQGQHPDQREAGTMGR